MTAPVVTYGRSVSVLADRFFKRVMPDWAEQATSEAAYHERVDAWLNRTDYAWICSARSCEDRAGVMYKTPAGAKRGAQAHASEHPGATVQQAEE